jgi:Caspase domain/Sulfatase-modifying factor enzyme 1
MFLMKKILQLLVLQLFVTTIFAQTSVNAARKKALVIGNGAYPMEPLKCPTNDARAMAAFLKKNGFDVTLDSNLNRQSMMNLIYHFRRNLSEGDISLFFFAGHGRERQRANYIYPIDDIEINLDTCYLSSLESQRCLLNIVLLNACRKENTTMSSQSTSIADFNSNMLLSFATAPNRYAYDRDSELSVYTESFLNIAQEGCSLNDIFPRLVDSVLQKTHHAQQPWVHHSMNSEVAGFKLLLPESFPMKKVTGHNGQLPFSIGQHEVTQAEWKEIMGDNPAFNKCHDCPIENVFFIDIQLFIKKLIAKTGKKYRLCTEGEWEYAACGGNLTPIYGYSGSDSLKTVGWYLANATKTQPVAKKNPNQFGVYDMSGNVWEWCIDANGIGVLRGGSLGQEKDSRLQNRFPQDATIKSRYYGFRLCED